MWNSSYGQHRYTVGDLVQLQLNGAVYEVRWRGWVFVPTQAGHRRLAVYQLEMPYWDCYYEDELGPLFSHDAYSYSPLWRK
jgi:hypothetical protein